MPSGSNRRDYTPLSTLPADEKEPTEENTKVDLDKSNAAVESRTVKWVFGWKSLIFPTYFFISIVAIFCLVIALVFQSHHSQCQSRAIDFSGYQCAPNGAEPTIARARGCDFDSLSFHWYNIEQHNDPDNQALLQDFVNEGPWHRYLDNKGKTEIPDNDWGRSLTTGFVTVREHVHHCKYTLRQTHLWILKGYDPPFDYNHTLHCTKYLVDVVEGSPPKDFDLLKIHGTPWPDEPAIIKPYYPCKEEGLSCISW